MIEVDPRVDGAIRALYTSEIKRLVEITLQLQNLVESSPNHLKYAHILDFKIFDDLKMHDANEIECLIFEIAIKNIVVGKVTKGGVSDANNKLIINIIQTVGSHRHQPVANRVNARNTQNHKIACS